MALAENIFWFALHRIRWAIFIKEKKTKNKINEGRNIGRQKHCYIP